MQYHCLYINISSVVNFKDGPKKQEFWTKINILEESHCILRIRGASVCRKLNMILENKVVQKLKLEKNVFTKNGLLNRYS